MRALDCAKIQGINNLSIRARDDTQGAFGDRGRAVSQKFSLAEQALSFHHYVVLDGWDDGSVDQSSIDNVHQFAG